MTETAQPDPMEVLIDRSGMFEAAILSCFPEAGVVLAVSSPQYELVAAACALSCLKWTGSWWHACTPRSA